MLKNMTFCLAKYYKQKDLKKKFNYFILCYKHYAAVILGYTISYVGNKTRLT